MYGTTSSALKSTHIHNDPAHFFYTYTDYTYSYLFVLCLIGHVWTISQGKKQTCFAVQFLMSYSHYGRVATRSDAEQKHGKTRRHGHGNLLWEIKLVGVIPAPLKKKVSWDYDVPN